MMIGKHSFNTVVVAAVLICFPVFAATNNDEENIGQAAVAQILGAAPLLETQAIQQYVNLVGNSVAAVSGSSYVWRFGVIKSDAVNAFAAPGGYVLVTNGLLKLLETEDELAFVLAHETVHVSRKHHYNVVKRQRLVEQAAKNLQSIDKEDNVAMLSSLSGQMYARGLDKVAEYDADRLGVELMTQAGYDPAAAIGVLEKLMVFQGNDPRAELLLSTHPSPASRIDQLAASGIDKLPKPKNKSSVVEKRFKSFRALL